MINHNIDNNGTVAAQKQTIAPKGWAPLAMTGDKLIIANGMQISYRIEGRADACPVFTLPAKPLTAAADDFYVYVFTTAGVYRLVQRIDGHLDDLGMVPDIPGVTLSSVDNGAYPVNIYPSPVDKLPQRLRAAQDNGVAIAAQSGDFVNPILVAVRFLDRAGNILHTSQPRLLCSSHVIGFRSPQAFSIKDDSQTTVEKKITLHGYYINATVPQLENPAWAAHIATMQILATPQLHPYTFGSDAQVTYAAGGTSCSAYCGFSPANIAGADKTTSQTALRQITQRFDNLAQVIHVSKHPFLNPGDRGIHPMLTQNVRQEIETVIRSLCDEPVACTPQMLHTADNVIVMATQCFAPVQRHNNRRCPRQTRLQIPATTVAGPHWCV